MNRVDSEGFWLW